MPRDVKLSVGAALLLCLLSAVLLILSFPSFNLEFLAWFAFIPFFFALEDRPRHEMFLLAYFAGLIFWCGTIYWLIYVSLPGFVLLVLYLSVYFGIFGLLFRLRPLTAVVGWVALEFLRSYAFSGFPWALLGYSQYLNIRMIQIADLITVWGISFLVIATNLAIYRVMRRRFATVIPTAAACLCIAFLYGHYRLNQINDPANKSTVKISILQGSIPQHQKWDKKFKESILARYSTLTKEAANDKPDLIIWPETAIPGVIDEEPELLAYALIRPGHPTITILRY
ncbi:MAG: apolipoprotein N-acyltransferase [Candidatus Omnitrophica bacterium]|nr:apolipoprotein N-acyltransferase [Candidatus Omnitrophota bacterium]